MLEVTVIPDSPVAEIFACKCCGGGLPDQNLEIRIVNRGPVDITLQSRFRLGGLFELPGFAENEVSGQQAVLLRLGYMRPMGLFAALPTYWGLTLQYGNVFEDQADVDWEDLLAAGSVFVGLESALGPLYFGYGYAESGQNTLYLLLGRPLF